MNRSTMREQAFKLIYSLEMQKQENLENQLDLYKEALENALKRKVDKVYIYSVYLGKEIEIK